MCSIRRVLDLNCIRRCILCCVLDGRQNDFVTKLSGLQQILLQQEVISCFVTSLVTGCSRDPVAGGLSMEPLGEPAPSWDGGATLGSDPALRYPPRLPEAYTIIYSGIGRSIPLYKTCVLPCLDNHGQRLGESPNLWQCLSVGIFGWFCLREVRNIERPCSIYGSRRGLCRAACLGPVLRFLSFAGWV